jgi:hypothetical protein
LHGYSRLKPTASRVVPVVCIQTASHVRARIRMETRGIEL